MKKHSHHNEEDGESVFDINRLFELNLSTELAMEQKKTMQFIDDEDQVDDLLYKHHTMLKRFAYNFESFNEGLEMEIRTEEEFESDLIQVS